jgi:hypothetical protein
MGQDDTTRIKVASVALALVFCVSCKVEEQILPTGGTGSDSGSGSGSLGSNTTPPGSQTLTAPILSDPLSGATVTESQPTLTVLNSARSGGEAPSYLFQVSADSTFTSLEAQSNLIPEGSGGRTSWEVNRALATGQHFWRVRARAGTTESSFSSTADFRVNTSGTSSPPPAPPPSSGTILSDPLRGGSIGEVNGGAFVTGGWQVRSNADYIRYEVPSLSSGWVEFDTSGLLPENPDENQFMLFGMWDPSAGSYRQNPFRVHLQKLHPNPHNPPYLRVRWIAQGEEHDEGTNFVTWGPNRTYRWRIEWGPSGSAQQARVLLEGQVMITVKYSRSYSPDVHWIELGIAERQESIVGVTYSNFRVGK